MPTPCGGSHPSDRAISRRRLLQFGLPALGLGLADVLRVRLSRLRRRLRESNLLTEWL